MTACACGRQFRSEDALAHHRRDRAKLGDAASACWPRGTTRPSSKKSWVDAWLWKGVQKQTMIYSIRSNTINTGSTKISSSEPAELICSYNWHDGTTADFTVPGETVNDSKIVVSADVKRHCADIQGNTATDFHSQGPSHRRKTCSSGKIRS